MEVDGDLEVLGIAVAAGALLHGRDLRVQALGDRIADAVAEVGQHVGQVPGNGLGRVDHGRQAAVGGPEVPALPRTVWPTSPDGNSRTDAATFSAPTHALS